MLVENELKNLQTFGSSLFTGQSYFNNDRAQLYLIFQPIYKTIITFSGLQHTISKWESKGLSHEKLNLLIQQIKVSPQLVWMNNFKIRLEFKGNCLKQEDFTIKIW